MRLLREDRGPRSSRRKVSVPYSNLSLRLMPHPAKDGKQLSKVIKKESKIEKEALALAIKELAELQAIQKANIKVCYLPRSLWRPKITLSQIESKAHTAHTVSLTALQKHEHAYHAARARYESAQAEALALEEALETSRRNAREATESMQEKMREVEGLRAQKGVDAREREVMIVELTGKKTSTLKRWL
jgi:hypothetical protein